MTAIETVGDFRLTFMHAIDLAATMTPEAATAVQNARGRREAIIPAVADHQRLLWPHGVASFTETRRDQSGASARQRQAFARFHKAVLTPSFVEDVLPETYSEANGTALSTQIPHVRVGEESLCGHLIGSMLASDSRISLRRSSLTAYRDGVVLVSFEFHGAGLPLRDFVELVAGIPTATQAAAGEKVAAVLRHGAETLSPFAPDLSSYDTAILDDPAAAMRRFGATHVVAVVQSFLDATGRPLSHDQLRKDPGLVGVLRRTLLWDRYRPDEISDIGRLCLGFKSDELYATLRGTTLALVPGHWNPDDFLALYVDDLLHLIEYGTSRISLVDFTLNRTYGSYVIAVSTDVSATQLVAEILLLRRLLLTIEESLDPDLLVNHFFTRQFIEQFQFQRGLPNKFAALQRRVESLDGILGVMAESHMANRGMDVAVRQIRLGVIALLASVALALASLIVSISK